MGKEYEVRRWVRLLANVRDRAVAVRFARSELERMSPASAAMLLTALAAAADARDPRATDAMLLCSIALSEDQRLRATIARAAVNLGASSTARRLLESERPQHGRDEYQATDTRTGRPLTLGERKTLARGRDRQLLMRVLRDPHRDVVRILLGNPMLTENDVVRLCARRPIQSDVLREVFRSPKWMTRPSVRLALIKNPSLPLDLALSLVPHLRAHEAREVIGALELPETLREACSRRFEPKMMH